MSRSSGRHHDKLQTELDSDRTPQDLDQTSLHTLVNIEHYRVLRRRIELAPDERQTAPLQTRLCQVRLQNQIARRLHELPRHRNQLCQVVVLLRRTATPHNERRQ